MYPLLNLAFHNRLLPDEVKELMMTVLSLDLDERITRALLRFFRFVDCSMQGIHTTNSVVSLSLNEEGILNAQFVVVNPLTSEIFFLAQLGCGTREALDLFTNEFVARSFKDVYQTVTPLSTLVMKSIPYESLRNSLYEYMCDLRDDLASIILSSHSNYMHLSDTKEGVLKVTRAYPQLDDAVGFNVTVQSMMKFDRELDMNPDEGMIPYVMRTMDEARTALAN